MGFGRPRLALRWLLLLAAIGGIAPAGPGSAQQVAAAPAARPAQAASSPAASAQSAPVAENSLKGDRARTKFIIGLERAVEFQVFTLTSPNRVFVDLPDVKLQLPPEPGAAAIGLVKSFRGGSSAPGKARVVIDVIGPVIVDRAVIEKAKDAKTAQLVLEIVPAETPAESRTDTKRPNMLAGAYALGAGSLQPPIPRPAVSPQARALGAFKPVIVLDPGHGGDDTGAQKNGAVEKNVVLAFSLVLRDKLNATGRYKVLMTRDTDAFVELNARREFAEKNMASLFVAVHADYANSKARGATIYSLRESVSNALQRSARDEVAGNVLSDNVLAVVRKVEDNVGALREILADLARREVDFTRDRTGVFVKSVIEHMGESTNLKDNPDRTAAFVVIKSAKVPSILIELGYVTNEADAQLLMSEVWRDKVSASIVTAIDNYFSHQLARLPM
jgi:N-acetylmuramoyl-L-alanine amidase